MSKRTYTNKEKERKITHFQRVIRYRRWFGWAFATVGSVLFFVGVENEQNVMVMINGALFFGYGLFMVRQAKKAAAQLRSSS
jgi:hypothetical protein